MSATQTAIEPTRVRIVEPITLLDKFNKFSDRVSRRAYELFEGNGKMFNHDLEDWFKAESEVLHPIHIRMAEKDDALTVEAEVPGFSAKDLEVSVEPWRLTISGKKETKEEKKSGKTIYQEQCSNELFRRIDLPTEISGAKVTATLTNGVLEVTLPRVAKPATTGVDVKAS